MDLFSYFKLSFYKNMLFRNNFFIPVIWNSAFLAVYSSTQFYFGRQVKVGNTPLSRAASDDKLKVYDPGKTAI